MKKVVVTGAGGYIGRHVIKKLCDAGYDTYAVDLHKKDWDERAKFCNVKIFSGNPDIYEELGRPDVLIHLAWRDGFVHNSPAHMNDLSSHMIFLRNMIEGGLPLLTVMGTMHEVGYWGGLLMRIRPAIPCPSMESLKMPCVRVSCL